jgi:hypothetical protein
LQITSPPVHVDAGRIGPPVARSTSPRSTPWPTAEEEKAKLFEQAQATAKRTQAQSQPSSKANVVAAVSGSQGASTLPTVSAGAALYSHALSSMGSKPTGNQVASGSGPESPTASAPAPVPPAPAPAPVTAPVPQYPTAEEEKAALRRYHEAKLAVDRTQNTVFSPTSEGPSGSPVPYDALYPSPSGSKTTSSDMPPPFNDPPSQQPAWLNEKEKLRRAYEAQDEARMQSEAAPSPISQMTPPLHITSSGSLPSFAGPSSSSSTMYEKEMLRGRHESQDSADGVSSSSPPKSPPTRASRSIPVPPATGNSRPLTAAEEKAQLRRKYMSEDQTPQSPTSNGTGPPNASSASSPPPLMPKPPKEYIRETREEDARVSRMADINNPASVMNGHQLTPSPSNDGFGLSPTSPTTSSPGPPPPLPPKVPLV